jgi:hypothetical protein
VAVRKDRTDAVTAKAESLIDQYEVGGRSCAYDCVGGLQIACEQSRCALVTEPASQPDGGAADTAGGGSPLASAQLQISPADGTTASGMDLTLRLYDYAGIVDDAKLAEVSAQAVLQTWPEGTPVAFTTDTLAEAPPSYKVVRIVPTSPLTDRWYLAGLRGLPAKITYYTPAPLPDGKPGVRFRPGSHPRVSQIQFCLKEGAGMKLIVGLSETVTLNRPTDELVALKIGGADSPCAWTGATSPTPLVVGGLPYACAALAETASVIVTVAPGGTAAGGATLEGGSWPIDIAKLPAGSCRTFQPQI